MSAQPQAKGGSLHRFANPARFLRIADRVYPYCLTAMILAFTLGLALALFFSPADYQQGETVRIMYVHVPAAWMAMFVYAVTAVASASLLVWRHPLAGIAAKASAPVGAAFTFLALVTGSLWGKPMWGTWWVWDARLTSVLILFFVYLGLIALSNAFENPERGQRASAVLAIVGAINLPIIKFSVDWWNTLHQPASVTRLGTPAIHPDMLWPLLVMALAFKLFFITVLIDRIRAELLDNKLKAMNRAALHGQAKASGESA